MSDRQCCVTADRREAKSETRFAFAGADAAPSAQVRSYLKMFGCIAVIVRDTGQVSVSRDPVGPMRGGIEAIWCVSSPVAALAIKERCEAEEHGDVVSTAAGLRITLTSNTDAIARAEAAIARMNALVNVAKQRGLMKMLNARYAEERQHARRQGRAFPSYNVVHKRFVQALLRIAAGQTPSKSLVDQAIGNHAIERRSSAMSERSAGVLQREQKITHGRRTGPW
jgi:hypothetical protein